MVVGEFVTFAIIATLRENTVATVIVKFSL